jgi:hypothetical protein
MERTADTEPAAAVFCGQYRRTFKNDTLREE